jgi:glycolate oxidase FAD binding subunit
VSDSITIDGVGPLSVHRPATVAEAGELIRSSPAVYPVGGRTHLGFGLPPSKPGIALDTTGWNRIVEYPARDMTVTVQAGITVAELQATLAREGQWLPVDLPRPDQATLGGAVAANVSGPRRFGYGTLRDYLIGIRFLADTGEEIRGGGRVVKNVAGYDLMKLNLGALGSFGVITELTFKVKPRTESAAVVTFGVPSADLAATLDQLHASASRPIAVDVVNAAAAKAAGLESNDPWLIVLGFEEKTVTVNWQIDELTKERQPRSPFTILRNNAAFAGWSKLTELPCRADSKWIAKCSVLPSQVAAVVINLAEQVERIHAHALNGVLWLHSTDELTATVPGSRVVHRAPETWKTSDRVWGPPRGDFELMRHIKNTLDPRNVFNPGRMFAA